MGSNGSKLPPREAMDLTLLLSGLVQLVRRQRFVSSSWQMRRTKICRSWCWKRVLRLVPISCPGAVIDPVGLNALIPDWKEKGAPLDTQVARDRFMYLGPAGDVTLPNFIFPPLMSNHGNYIGSLGAVARWLGEQAAELGVEVYPGLRPVRFCLMTPARLLVLRRATWVLAQMGSQG